MTLCTLSGITKRYRGGAVPVLENLSFSLKSRELVAIMGASGSGKSTLLHILGCLDLPDAGSYQLEGEEVSVLSDEKRSLIRSEKIGFVFQAFNLIPEMTLKENVELPLFYRKSRGDLSSDEAISAVGLSHRKEHLPSELSGGELQRAAIARALFQKPALFLADEPTGNLDTQNRNEVLKLFSLLKEQGTASVVVTHDPHVASFTERTLYLKGGALAHF